MRQCVKVAMAALVVLALLVSSFGCATTPPASPTTAPAAPAAPTAAPAPAQPTAAPAATQPAAAPTTAAAAPAGDVIELKYHHHDPPQSAQAEYAHNAWAKLIEEKTNGKVKITIYPAETLGKSSTAIDMAMNGVADIAWGFIGMFPGRFPVTDMLGLPFIGAVTGEQDSQGIWESYLTIPEIQKEFEGLHVLFLHGNTPHIVGTNKPVKTLEDLKGLRLRTIAGAPLKYFQALGATPVNVPMPEVFEALQKGTIDGFATEWAGIGSFKFDEVTKYYVDDALYSNVFFLVMNQKKWDSLPPDVQQVFNELGGAAGAKLYGGGWDKAASEYAEVSKGKGVQVTKLSEEERARWIEKASVVWDEYIKIVDSKGADGKAILEKMKANYAKFQ